MGENNLEEIISEKDLGIYIDNKLRLSDHVDAAVNKANRLVGLIRRSYEYLDGDSLVQLLQDRSKQGRECTKNVDQAHTTDSRSRIPRETPDTKATVHSLSEKWGRHD